jgi:hypothetical protein
MSENSTIFTSALTALKDFSGGVISPVIDAGNSVIKSGSNATDVSVYGVPLLTVSMIAITSVILAYVTIGQSSDNGGEVEETGFMNNLTNSYGNTNSNISSQLGGKLRTKKRRGKHFKKTRRGVKK